MEKRVKKIGFLGCGKIGKALYREIKEKQLGQVIFIQDSGITEFEDSDVYITATGDEELYRQADLIIECATAMALAPALEAILRNCDLLVFSVTAFSDPAFEEQVKQLTKEYGRKVYIPHGAILGLDGILDGKSIWEEVSVQTIKNPQSLGRNDMERTIIYDGSTREACKAYPRNVNVHAAVAIAGIGFEKTRSLIISDPSVNTNSHVILLKGQGVTMEIHVKSFTKGGVTGEYTPISACGSLNRILDEEMRMRVV